MGECASLGITRILNKFFIRSGKEHPTRTITSYNKSHNLAICEGIAGYVPQIIIDKVGHSYDNIENNY